MSAVMTTQGAPTQGARLSPQAHDFAPDLLTLQESPPARMPRAVMVGVAVLVGGMVAWGALAQLDIVASAQGRLVPQSFTKVVQPSEAGIVSDILVNEGQAVQAGQVLMRLDPRLTHADVHAQTRDVALKRLSLQRIAAELADAPLVLHGVGDVGSVADPDLLSQVQMQYQARRRALADATDQERQGLLKARADLTGAQQVLSKLQQTVPLYEQSAVAHDKLFKEGFVGEVAANEKKRDWLEKMQDLKAQESTVLSLQALIAQSESKLAGIQSTYRSQLESERLDIQTQLTKSAQELSRSQIRATALEIKAPTNGIVKDLALTSAGAVVQAGALLLNLVPQGESVQAEVLVANEDVGFVNVGQAVQLKVAAYPFQKYGLLQGTVTHLSADAQDARQQANTAGLNTNLTAMVNGSQTYRALIKLDQQTLNGPGGKPLLLSPGMQVTAELHQGRRTVIEYLLSPVQKVTAEAARER